MTTQNASFEREKWTETVGIHIFSFSHYMQQSTHSITATSISAAQKGIYYKKQKSCFVMTALFLFDVLVDLRFDISRYIVGYFI